MAVMLFIGAAFKRILFHPYHGFVAYATVYMNADKLQRTKYTGLLYSNILCNDSKKNKTTDQPTYLILLWRLSSTHACARNAITWTKT